MVSACASSSRLVLAQAKVEAKSNEITAVPALLSLLDLNGCIVTADAMSCRKAIAAQIVQPAHASKPAANRRQDEQRNTLLPLQSFGRCQEGRSCQGGAYRLASGILCL